MGPCTIFIKSSSGGRYSVIVDCDESAVHAIKCDCNAGMFGTFCKHLRTIFEADESMLDDGSQSELFRHLSALALRSMIGSLYAKLQNDLRHIEIEKKELVKRANGLKQEFMRQISKTDEL